MSLYISYGLDITDYNYSIDITTCAALNTMELYGTSSKLLYGKIMHSRAVEAIGTKNNE